MRRRLVAGNWKMHGGRAANEALLQGILSGVRGLGNVDLAVCVPYPYLVQAADRLRDSAVGLGAQNVSEHAQGAYTGEVSAPMLADCGCRYVIVGHSERRQLYGESDAQVAAKFAAVQSAGMTPILCVGETLAERDGGKTENVVQRQLDAVLSVAGARGFANAVLAYEPVWAIGTGRNATPEQARDVHAFLRARLAQLDAAVARELRILYGGSVKAANAAALFAMPELDGGLIGGASLVAQEFLAIGRAARKEN
jgi:triosephosphate isomerase (TIM)